MAIIINEQYPGKTAPADTEYPLGKARNVTTPGDGTGTPWEQAIVNDDQGFKQAILKASGVSPSGVPDTALESQYLKGLQRIFTGNIPAIFGVDGQVSIPVVLPTGDRRNLIMKWAQFNTTGNNTFADPQYVSLTGVSNAIFYASLSEDGGAAVGLETAQIDWGRTNKDRLAVYSNYVGICKYLLVGW